MENTESENERLPDLVEEAWAAFQAWVASHPDDHDVPNMDLLEQIEAYAAATMTPEVKP